MAKNMIKQLTKWLNKLFPLWILDKDNEFWNYII